jgi:hypothetical protein
MQKRIPERTQMTFVRGEFSPQSHRDTENPETNAKDQRKHKPQ